MTKKKKKLLCITSASVNQKIVINNSPFNTVMINHYPRSQDFSFIL